MLGLELVCKHEIKELLFLGVEESEQIPQGRSHLIYSETVNPKL
jgi:hypothetical protein